MKTFRLLLGLTLLVSAGPLEAQESKLAFGGVHPRISPDGKRLAVSWQGGIWTAAIDGEKTDLVQLTTGSPWDIEPVWSPDGKRIAFLRTGNFFGGRLQIVEADSGAEIPLPKGIRAEGKLFFGADGKRLLGVLGDAGGFSQRPAWLDLESGEVSVVEIGPEDPAAIWRKRMKFALAPDGESIVYAVHRDENDEQGGNRGSQADVWRCAADGSNAEKLFAWPARIYDMAFDGNDACLVVTDLGAVHNDIWRLPFESPLAEAEKLTMGQADDDRPSIDSSGNRLLWSDNAGGATSIRVRERKSGRTRDWAPGSFHFSKPTGVMKLHVAERSSGGGVGARVSIRNTESGNFVAPPGALYRMTGAVGHFYVDADGRAEFELPAGNYALSVFRGPEYAMASTGVTIEEGKSADAVIELERWTHQAERGWYSGENHVHANYGYGEWYNTPATILRQCQGENLNVCNAVIANSDGEAIFDREFFLGQVDPRSTEDTLMFWGQEFRATLWGHMTLSNLSQLVEPIMTGFSGTTNPWDVPTNADIAQRAIDQGGLIGYTHPAGNRLDLYDQPYSAKGLPVDAALGRVALMDVMGHTYEGSTQLWYRLMNCGIRVVASSGTDCFLNRVRSLPPGWARTYVHLPDGLDYRAWTEGQAAGRSFITSAPMLEFEVEGKPGMGAELKLSEAGTISVEARARSQFPMDRVELVFNGDVVETVTPNRVDGAFLASFAGEVEIAESGWLALRAHGPAVAEVIKDPAAHGNPVWIEVAGKPNSRAAQDAGYFLKWIDRLQAAFEARERWPSENHRRNVLRQLDKAREFYREVRGGG